MARSQPTDCSAAIDRLQARLDGDCTALSEPIQLHIDACPTCRERFRAADLLLRTLRSTPPVTFQLTDRVVSSIHRDATRRRHGWRVVWSAWAAVAASVAIWWITRTPGSNGTVPVETDRPQTMAIASTTIDVGGVGGAFASVPFRTAAELAGRGHHLLPNVAIPATLPAVDGTSRPLDEARNGLAEGFEPVTVSARRAFGLLAAFSVAPKPVAPRHDETRQ